MSHHSTTHLHQRCQTADSHLRTFAKIESAALATSKEEAILLYHPRDKPIASVRVVIYNAEVLHARVTYLRMGVPCIASLALEATTSPLSTATALPYRVDSKISTNIPSQSHMIIRLQVLPQPLKHSEDRRKRGTDRRPRQHMCDTTIVTLARLQSLYRVGVCQNSTTYKLYLAGVRAAPPPWPLWGRWCPTGRTCGGHWDH